MIRNENEIGRIVINTAFDVHQRLGIGLLESVYEAVLVKSLERQGLSVSRQVPIRFSFDGVSFEEGFRADVIVENKVIIEFKSIEKLNNSHKKQLLTYLRLSGMRLGYLINFGESYFKGAVVRIVNNLDE